MCGRIAYSEKTPFGTSSRRFLTIGLHPKLGGRGGDGAALGTYSPRDDILKRHFPNVNWNRQLQTKHFSEILGGRAPHILWQRIRDKKCGGPAVQNLPTFLELLQQQSSSVKHNVGLGTVKRFFNPLAKQDVVPGPGTYGAPEKPGKPKTLGTNVPPFLWDGCQKRRLIQPKGYGLPPTTYTVHGEPGSIEALLNKVVSKRGPYDLFTGLRDYSSIKNHFSPASTQIPDCLFVPSPEKVMPWKGKWRRGPRFQTFKKEKRPSPAQYNQNPLHLKPVNRRPPPFMLGVVHVRPKIGTPMVPGVGRYHPKWTNHVNPICSPFRSTTPQTQLFRIVSYTAF